MILIIKASRRGGDGEDDDEERKKVCEPKFRGCGFGLILSAICVICT